MFFKFIMVSWSIYRSMNWPSLSHHGPLARYVKLRVAHAPGMFSPPPRVSDPDMHHGTYVAHVPWCMPGSLTSGFLESGGGENVPDILGECTTRSFTYLARGPLVCFVAKPLPEPMVTDSQLDPLEQSPVTFGLTGSDLQWAIENLQWNLDQNLCITYFRKTVRYKLRLVLENRK